MLYPTRFLFHVIQDGTLTSSYMIIFQSTIETINDALKSVNRDDLVITKPQFDILSLISKIL